MNVEIVFWDVQHGNASYIKSPNNRHIVIDLGTGKYAQNYAEFSPLLYLKRSYGIYQLDYVVITHPHLDHIDDIMNFDILNPKVFKRLMNLTKEEIMRGIRDKDRFKFDKYFEINERYNIPLGEHNPNDPSIPDNYGGLIINGFNSKNCSTSNLNNHSIIMIISYAEMKVVFAGDNESCSFDELLEDSSFISLVKDADVLLAPHHGRAAGYHEDFLNLVNPRLTVVSDGRFCDTSATSRYSKKSRGWEVNKRSGGKEKRYCLTTRNDGVISVNFGYSINNSRFLSVTID